VLDRQALRRGHWIGPPTSRRQRHRARWAHPSRRVAPVGVPARHDLQPQARA
jgi:hypothetical protein